jgi:hypothetical protein
MKLKKIFRFELGSVFLIIFGAILLINPDFGSAAVAAVAVSGLAAVLVSVIMFTSGRAAAGVFMIGGAIACMGLTVLMFLGSGYVAKGLIFLTKLSVKGIKKLFVKGGDKE